MSQNDFEDYWAGRVSASLGVSKDLIATAYDKSSPNSTDGVQRSMLKYAWAKGVNGTPTAFMNGVKLDSAPRTVRGWMNLLQETYDS